MKKKLTALFLLMISGAVGVIPSYALEDRSSIDAVTTDTTVPGMRVVSGGIELMSGGAKSVRFQIFSITGQLIKSVTVESRPVIVEMPKGFYIVKCESWTRRVMIK